jgi:two-component system cell cycle response regulator CpdR
MGSMTTPGTTGDIPHRILLVEDNDMACRTLARLLEAWGFQVTMTHDGTSALRALDSDPPPDFVLTDLSLPDLDGREVARHAHGLQPTPRIALITGWDLDSELADYRSWGIDWIFPKPLDTYELISRLRESLEAGESEA